MRRRRGQSRQRWTGGRIARVAVAAAAALFLGWWAVRSAVVNALSRGNPFVADAVARSDPRAAVEMAMLEFALRGGRVGAANEARALGALDRSAFADEPFLLAAVDAAAHGNAARSEALLEEARRREPRSRMTRLLLLDRYLRTGRSEEAGAELAVLVRLVPDAGGAVLPQLVPLARDPKTQPGLARMLRRNPNIRDNLLRLLSANPKDAELVLQLAAASGSGSGGDLGWQGVLLGGLVGHGELDRAYAVWRGFLAQRGEADVKGLYDGDFRGAPGSPPFNWTFANSADGVAERTSAPALQVQYYGRTAAELASQLLLLRPGSYTLQFRVEGNAKGDGSHLTWAVVCAGTNRGLLEMPLKGIVSAPRTLSASFTVPGECRGQWLRLHGSSGDVATEQDVTISSMRLVAAGGRR